MAEEVRTSGSSRGEFLAKAAGVTGMAIGAGVWAGGALAQTASDDVTVDATAAAATTTRSFVSGNFALELDGVMSGLLKSVEGGNAVADVVQEKQIDYFARKHISNVRYEEFTLQMGFSMSKAVYDWVAASWKGNGQRHDGAIDAADFNLDIKGQRQFFQALVTEFTIPACDASSKDPGYLTLKFSPETARSVKAGGKLAAPSSKQKQWLPANFKLAVDGLDATKVNKIDSFTIKQSIVIGEIGDERDFQREPGKLEFPNLAITLAETSAQSWLDWFEDFVINGNSGQSDEKNGSLTFLASNLKDELGTINFFNLGIFKLAPEKAESNSDSIRRLKAELYCERMELHIPPGGIIT